MKLHTEELALARAYVARTALESLTHEQMKEILDHGRALYRWSRDHPRVHCLVNLSVIVVLLAADGWTLLRLPRVFLSGTGADPLGRLLLAGLVCGGLHSWLMYSLGVFSVHEGAAHAAIFPPRGPATRVLNFLANNLCRLAATEPHYYSEHHLSHHNKFGTEEDGEFLNFVLPRRFWLTLLPFAAFLNFSDFLAHRPLEYTRSRIVSALLSIAYNVAYGTLMVQAFGGRFVFVALVVVLPHVGFLLDRLRQFSEHNLLPLENKDGSRSFGVGFWGMLIGGGPWGSPCHWERHFARQVGTSPGGAPCANPEVR